jgi:hypothetical protein
MDRDGRSHDPAELPPAFFGSILHHSEDNHEIQSGVKQYDMGLIMVMPDKRSRKLNPAHIVF